MEKESTARMWLPYYKVIKTAKDDAELQEFNPDQQEYLTWPHIRLRTYEAWAETLGEGVKVAVLDTGIDMDHPDLDGQIVATQDFTGDGIQDVNGHGTHCAGIIAAKINDVGFIGVAPKAKLIIGKVLGNDGSGAYEWISDGVRWAFDEGADVISMSLGGPSTTPGLFQSIHEVLAQGGKIICAAGNDGSLYTNNIGFPGKYGSVITVASHDYNGNPSGFSSRGGELDFIGPGDGIWSTYTGGSYRQLSGTSMATPYVAGLAALIISKHKQAGGDTPVDNNEDLREHLMRMASHPGFFTSDEGYGALLPFKYF